MIQIHDDNDNNGVVSATSTPTPYLIASTRFNTDTYKANQEYRQRYQIPAIYSNAIPISEKYPPNATTFVVEMNNTTNQIEGIGKIRNQPHYREMKRIYGDVRHAEYNAYIYKGTRWVSAKTIQDNDPNLLTIFNHLLFKKKTHMKRQAGISIITHALLKNWMPKEPDVVIHKGMKKILKRIIKVFAKSQKQTSQKQTSQEQTSQEPKQKTHHHS